MVNILWEDQIVKDIPLYIYSSIDQHVDQWNYMQYCNHTRNSIHADIVMHTTLVTNTLFFTFSMHAKVQI